MIDDKKIIEQSKAAYAQWAEQWRSLAKVHSKYEMKPLTDFENTGVGRAVLCVANGYSFEENIEIIKKHQHNVDILCCDKTFGHLVSNGITPKYIVVCDANVDFDRYLKPYLDHTKNTILFSNVCGNDKWSECNWKDRYFFVNKDVLGSEKEFGGIAGCVNYIPAATNVSNAMVVLLTQSDNNGRKNFFGYDKIILIGFDYSWRNGKKYYSFSKDGDGKENYMCHAYITTHSGEFAYTSGNLSFSAEWLGTYAMAFRLPLMQCSKATITNSIPFGDLETQMQYRFRPQDRELVKSSVTKLRNLMAKKKEIEKQLAILGKDHWFQHVATS